LWEASGKEEDGLTTCGERKKGNWVPYGDAQRGGGRGRSGENLRRDRLRMGRRRRSKKWDFRSFPGGREKEGGGQWGDRTLWPERKRGNRLFRATPRLRRRKKGHFLHETRRRDHCPGSAPDVARRRGGKGGRGRGPAIIAMASGKKDERLIQGGKGK